jgi:hypothetical protein
MQEVHGSGNHESNSVPLQRLIFDAKIRSRKNCIQPCKSILTDCGAAFFALLRGPILEPFDFVFSVSRRRAAIAPVVTLFSTWKRQAAGWDRDGLDERGRGLTEGQKLVENAVEIVEAVEVNLEDETILARDAVTLRHLRQALRQSNDLRQRSGCGANPDKGSNRKSERTVVEFQPVALDHTGIFQPLNTLPNGRRGHFYPACELRNTHPRIAAQQFHKLDIAPVTQEFGNLKAHTGFFL